ncbi:MBL fold metallo-hydrolase [Natronobacterium gregoryi]|uniref:Beta-lactamase domain-containing protein n=2 Tax=Natronobacterium gregoryi TaxID=44930 RepID=L0AH07_NATGS|nr:MBL fold metallo-hydrolase [Natronobacterium gregoryi]AFZ72452.1 Zn-dependent hydrolase, glyoxylase [Natronobacterium gregoryi SP2]ELY74323.1 beta-lactamase domain-containing protein [Natronobacterium gregoryi SP2]PLK21426.1 MBL fold metallo-hydrolase [Natronobacterium gregoryi SP2]SFI78258.1 Glyoxylase, beta-lactamase superfamily II [Natronobacterium gregoryi]
MEETLTEVTTGDCSDLYYVDTGMYDTSGYGVAYVLDAERPAVVETGIGTNHERILEALDELGIEREELEVVAVTHIHLDHAGGAGFLAEACPNADVCIPAAGASLLADPGRLVAGTKSAVGEQWQYYVEPEPIPEERIVKLEDGDVIDLGDHELRVHAAPGHAFHQVVFEDPVNDAVFTGDAAGIWLPDREQIVETSPPSDFDLEQCLEDVATMKRIDPDVLLYTHFGPRYVGEDLEDALEEYATVLSEWVETVEAKRAQLEDDEAVLEYVAEATELADAWSDHKARAEAKMNVRGVLGYLDESA